MRAGLGHLWRHHAMAIIAFVVVVGLTGFFGLRAANDYLYWADPAKQDQDLAGWMTPRYVARSYDVPPEVIKAAWNLAPDGPLKRASLDTIAAELGLTLAQMQAQVADAAAAYRGARP